MTLDEIVQRMDEINDVQDLTEDLMTEYEALEGNLQTVRRADEQRARHQAYATPVRSDVGIHVATTSEADEHMRAFDRYLRSGDKGILAEYRAQSAGVGAEGGFTVPEAFRQKLTDRVIEFGGLASVSEVISTSGGEDMRWPTLDDTANSAVIAAENTAPTGGADLVFAEKTLGAFRYIAPGATSLPLRVSVELLQDSAFDIQSLVQRKLGERIARAQATDWVQGVGTTEPQGIIAGTTQSAVVTVPFTGGAAGTTHGQLVDVIHTLDPFYRRNASWVLSDNMLGELRKLRDADGRPLWTPSADSGLVTQPGGVLLGHPVVIDSDFDDMDTAPALTVTFNGGVFGDIREGYVIRRVRDLQLIVDPFTRANEGQVQFTLWARADGVVQNQFAFVGVNSQTG